MNQNKSITEKNLQINGFRVVLLLIVMFYHFIIVFSKENVADFYLEYNYIPGQAATCIFLILSGWFLRIEKINFFWCKKLFRIILPFTIAVTTILAIRWAFGNFQIPKLDVLMNFLILPMNSNLFSYIDGAHWYIVVLVYFFIIYTIIFLIEKLIKKRFSFWLLFMLMFICFFVSIFIPPSNTISKIIRCVFPSHFVFIISGFLAAKIQKIPFNKRIVNILFLVVLILLPCLTCFFMFDWYQLVFFALLLSVAVFCQIKVIKIFEAKIFQIIGDASLWIYLLHQEIGYIIIKPFLDMGIMWVGVIIACISMIAIGTICSIIWNKFVLNNVSRYLIRKNN